MHDKHPLQRTLALQLGTAILAALRLSCSAPAAEPLPPSQPATFGDELALGVALDLSADPNVLEVNLEARLGDVELVPGKTTQAWTYDGGVPGPLLRAKVGDRLLVHFKNSLPEPTTIHWHGLRIPAAMDGVPGHSQDAIPPGGTFDYDFVLPDAGTYWYHPHFASAKQVGNGLYGPIIVDDPLEPEGLGDELILVLSDASVAADGALHPADNGGSLGTLFGREGGMLLVNGRINPTIHARAGLRQRWRIINAARSRFFQLSLPGHSFTRIGGDGGFIATPEVSTSLALAAAERADVLVEPTKTASDVEPSEQALVLRWTPHDRGFGTAFMRTEEDVLHIEFANEEPAQASPLPELRRLIPELDPASATLVDISLTLNQRDDGTFSMGINGVPSWEAEHVKATLGETQIWSVSNSMAWDHPFHLHGFFFQVLDVNGVAPTVREWKDTANVPVDGKLRFIVNFDARPGMWMFHCHILDHADAGMMGMIRLE